MKTKTNSLNILPAFFCLFAILASTLACNLPGRRNPVIATTSVIAVSVDPSMGSGSFNLTVVYQVEATQERFIPEAIDCVYVAPDGATIAIGTIMPNIGNHTGVILQSKILQIVATDQGSYTATCRNQSASSDASVIFVVANTYTGTGQRTWDGLYTQDENPTEYKISHCTSAVSVELALRADGTAWMQTLGEGKFGANCEKNYRINNDTQNMEWTLVGIYDPETEIATFTECNNTPGATGQVSYKSGILSGNASCKASTDPQYADLKVTITIP